MGENSVGCPGCRGSLRSYWREHQKRQRQNAALTHWEGVSLAGVVSADETCPVTVEKERLIFEIESFPDQSSEANSEIARSVTAEYTFYNPADYAVRARLLFPFGRLPSYAVRYDEQTGGKKSAG